MTRVPKERRKRRCITATDSEWRMITSRAGRAGTTNSRFMVGRALDAPEQQPVAPDTPPVLPAGVQWRMALAMLVLARIEERRIRDGGADELWDRLIAEEREFLDAEKLLETGRV